MKIALGYLLTFGWVFLILLAIQKLKQDRGLSDETSRKIVHIGVGFAWIPMVLCFGATWHLAVPTAVFIVLNAVSYRQNLFTAMERSDESRRSLGTVYYAVSMTLMALWTLRFPDALPAYGAGLFCMALGDGLAPIFGSIRRGNRRLLGSRTLYGSLCVFVVCLLVLTVFTLLWQLPLSPLKILGIATAGVLLELVGVRGYDNLTLPLGVCLLTWLLIQ